MALPKLTIKIFPPKSGKNYSGAGNLIIPMSDVHALAEWLLAQQGEYDDYLNAYVVKFLAFEYENTTQRNTTYRTIQLKDPSDFNSPQTAPAKPPSPTLSNVRTASVAPATYQHDRSAFDPSIDEIPF